MDRQAWIAITLCVLGLIGWQVYITKHAPQVAAPPAALLSPSPGATETPSAAPSATPAVVSAPTPEASPTPAPAPNEQFEERFETLANSDVELRLTNRGGAISEAHLLHHKADTPQGHVVLDSREHLPIGAIIENPSAPALPEFTMRREGD